MNQPINGYSDPTPHIAAKARNWRVREVPSAGSGWVLAAGLTQVEAEASAARYKETAQARGWNNDYRVERA